MHLLAFPTFFEGSSYAVYQALASGLPVITTQNCGSIVSDSCGIIVQNISPDEFYVAIEKLYLDRTLLQLMSEQAARVARQYTWQSYGAKLVDIIRSIETVA